MQINNQIQSAIANVRGSYQVLSSKNDQMSAVQETVATASSAASDRYNSLVDRVTLRADSLIANADEDSNVYSIEEMTARKDSLLADLELRADQIFAKIDDRVTAVENNSENLSENMGERVASLTSHINDLADTMIERASESENTALVDKISQQRDALIVRLDGLILKSDEEEI